MGTNSDRIKRMTLRKTFQLRALKNSSKNLTFQKENELFLRVQTAQFQSAKILDHCAQAQKRIATKNQWHQLCLVASSIKPSILPYTVPILCSLVYMPICSPICSLICSIRYQFEIPIAPNL